MNNTHIEDASDIDLVLMLKMPFESSVQALDEAGIDDFEEHHQVGHYSWEEFRDDVLAAPGKSYACASGAGASTSTPDWLFGEMVDILLAKYRLYSAFSAPGVELYEQGVFFRDREKQADRQLPQQHRRNGDGKVRTGGRFKEVVRTAQNVRRLADVNG